MLFRKPLKPLVSPCLLVFACCLALSAIDAPYADNAPEKVGGESRLAREELLIRRTRYGTAGEERMSDQANRKPFVVSAPMLQHSPSLLFTRADANSSTPQDLTGERVMLLPGKKGADLPSPAPDYSWVRRTIIALVLVIVLTSLVTAALFLFNKKLQREVAERKQAESAQRESKRKLKMLSDQTEQLSLAAAAMLTIKEERTIFERISKAIVDYSDYRRVIISLFKDTPPYRDIIGYGGLDEATIEKLRGIDMSAYWYDGVFEQGQKVGQFSYYIPHSLKHILNQEATVYGRGPLPQTDRAWHPEDNLFVRMNNEKGEFIGVISVDESKSGMRPSDETVRPLEIFSSMISQIILIKKEQTERKKLERQLAHTQKMESIGTLTGGIAHDFNNILSIILGNTELALSDVPESSPVHFNLKAVKTAGLRARSIVRQLLSFSHKTARLLKPVEIVPVIDNALNFLRSSIPATIDIRRRIRCTTETILADPSQLNQVMINLCVNASQMMEQSGGVIDVAMETVTIDAVTAASDQSNQLTAGPHVKITVRDTGQGISHDIIEKIFDPYFTTKEVGQGSGMGLAVVHGIIKSHNGAIFVDSVPGQGATFTIFFPITHRTPEVLSDPGKALPTGTESVLVVDDEESIAALTDHMLTRLGYQVETRTDPMEALALFQSGPERFDLVITDMTMPRMTGLQLFEKIRKTRTDIPVILCTGYTPLADKKTARQMGIAEYVMKPIEMAVLAATVRKVLDAPARASRRPF